jgi:hypothetical protein
LQLKKKDESFDLEMKEKNGVEKEQGNKIVELMTEMIESEREKKCLRYRWCILACLIRRFTGLSHDGRPICLSHARLDPKTVMQKNKVLSQHTNSTLVSEP